MAYKDAAEVCEKVSVDGRVSTLLDRAAHLAAIHKLSEAIWPETRAQGGHYQRLHTDTVGLEEAGTDGILYLPKPCPLKKLLATIAAMVGKGA